MKLLESKVAKIHYWFTILFVTKTSMVGLISITL